MSGTLVKKLNVHRCQNESHFLKKLTKWQSLFLTSYSRDLVQPKIPKPGNKVGLASGGQPGRTEWSSGERRHREEG